MKALLKRIFIGVCLVASVSVQASEKDWFFKPYVGADVGFQHQPFETGYGEHHFRENYPAAHYNVGVELHQYFAMEVGYQQMFARDRKSYYDESPTASVLGLMIAGQNDQSYISDVKSAGFVFSLIFKYPVLENTELFAVLGANWARMHLSTMKIEDNNAANRPVFWQSDRHAVARLGIGVKQKILPNFGGRLFYVWENSSRLEANDFPGFAYAGVTEASSPIYTFTTKPKSSHLIMAGLYYQSDWV